LGRITFEAAWYREVFDCRLVPDWLWIEAHQIEKLGRNVAPYWKAETRGPLEGNGVVMCPSSLRQKARKFL
jgi:hypothetical protein